MHIVAASQGGREYMEDTWIVEENVLNGIKLYAVFDGHGGEYVSEYLRDNFLNVFRDILKTGTTDIIRSLFLTIQTLEIKMDRSRAFQTGSTANIIVHSGEMLYVCNIGDSRSIMNSVNETIGLSIDHKPDSPKERKRIIASGGYVTEANPFNVARVDGVLAVSRSIGDLHLFPHVTWYPEISSIKLNDGNNFVVLATDGLWDVMSNNEVMSYLINTIEENKNIVSQGILHEAAKRCLMLSRQRGSMDNVTIVIATLNI